MTVQMQSRIFTIVTLTSHQRKEHVLLKRREGLLRSLATPNPFVRTSKMCLKQGRLYTSLKISKKQLNFHTTLSHF